MPIVFAIMPPDGPTSGGNTVTIIGVGLSGATSVLFGSTPALAYTVQSDGSILATVPPGKGTVAVTVTTPAGTSNSSNYTYQLPSAPVIFALLPPMGMAAGGVPVLILGNHLTAVTSVLFGSTPATGFTVLGDGAIMATSPPGMGTVQVTVASPAGVSNAAAFTYM